MENELFLPVITHVGVYDSAAYPKYRHGGVTPERVTELYEIELPTESGGSSYVDGESYPIVPDFILLAKPGQKRHSLLPYKCCYVHFRADGALRRRLDALPMHIRVDPKKAGQLFRDIIYLYAQPEQSLANEPLPSDSPANELLPNEPLPNESLASISLPSESLPSESLPSENLLLQSRLLELIWMLSDRTGVYVAGAVANGSVSDAMKYIESHLDSPLTLEELAESCHLSPVYFHRLFTKTLGVTPYRYVINKKLAAAKSQLIMTNKSCLDIALGLGFSSQSYFNYAFRKETGQSPLQFRRGWYSRYPG